ncbi:MAG: hypothetical protein ACK5O7_02155 [Holosporales bacterium]
MRLRTYFADTLSQALQQIRRDMGPDAIIVSSVKEAQGVRVTAAVEAPLSEQLPASSAAISLVNPVDTVNTLCRWFDEHHVGSEAADLLAARLSMVGDEVLARGVAAALSALFPASPLPPQAQDAAVTRLVLVGIPGAGKSVAAAKLAAEYLVAGHKDIRILSTDALKSGADRQLAAYAEALSVPFAVCPSLTDLKKALAESSPGQVVLVDTPGISPYADQDVQDLRGVIDGVEGHVIQVLPAGLDPFEATDLAGFFCDLGAKSMIHTRVDTVRRLGGLLHMLALRTVQPMAFGLGPELGDRLRPGTGEMLAQILQQKLNLSSPRQQHNADLDAAPRWRFQKGE